MINLSVQKPRRKPSYAYVFVPNNEELKKLAEILSDPKNDGKISKSVVALNRETGELNMINLGKYNNG